MGCCNDGIDDEPAAKSDCCCWKLLSCDEVNDRVDDFNRNQGRDVVDFSEP